MRYFPYAKSPGETRFVTIDFTLDLPPAVTLVGMPTLKAPFVYSGVPDPNAGTMLTGTLTTNGNILGQLLQGGIAGNVYAVEGAWPASNGEIIEVGALLTVLPSYLQ